ncbi:virulence-associated E family protein [Ruegeria sp. HKCCD7221]|uniref:virulence-associated E family protein n=1 Tax=Ruegeria sp. HKCCD7221 TaxID=2683009 RepID=UPI001489E7EA|nr:virulence-associated E family protein [Ruegeria sp. HKCCD7221]
MERNLNPVQSIDGIDSNGKQVDPRFGIPPDRFVRGRGNEVVWNTANAELMFEMHDDWKGCIVYDRFSRQYVLLKPIAGSRQPATSFPREFEDRDIVSAVSWFNRNGFPKASEKIVKATLFAHADGFTINPLEDYMNNLQWDGTERLSTWAIRYMGVQDSTYVRAVSRLTLISAVARAMKPGCKVDTVTVFEGTQGAKKSTAIEVLCPRSEWFGDNLPHLAGNEKEASQYLPGHFLIELSELKATKAETEKVKAFITRKVEDFRRPYKPNYGKEPRMNIFIGTTNKDDYLTDPTGNRRWLPLRCEDEIDISGLAEIKHQLWAEAVAAFKSGERWWLVDDMEAVAQKQQSMRMQDEPWLELIAEYVKGLDQVSPTQVLNGAIQLTPERMDYRATVRAGECLQRLGWVRKGQISSGDYRGKSRYVKPQN